LLEAALPHARALGCEDELSSVPGLIDRPPATQQLRLARHPDRLPGLVRELTASFTG